MMRKIKKIFGLIPLVLLTLIFVPIKNAHAQYFAFGQNKVQYKDFNWKYIQSQHFDIYYYQDKNYYLAVFAAQSLESALKEIENDFNYKITSRIKVIIYDSHNDFSQTNVTQLPLGASGIGGVTEPFKNRVTLPFMGSYGDFRHTLHHELVHAVINEMFYGGSVQSIIQNNIQLQIPNWFNEGMAEYSSIGFDTNEDDFLRDAILNDYMPPINQLYGYFWYRGGQSVWDYIVEEYGREKIGEIFHDIKNSRNVEEGFKQALGLSIEELSKRWQAFLKKRYLPEIANRNSLDEAGTQITKRQPTGSGSYNTSPALSPQGDRLAMITNQSGNLDIVVVNTLTGKKIKTLIKGQGNVNFEDFNLLNDNLTWSPDGGKIALSVRSRGSDELAIIDYRTGQAKKYNFPNIDAIGALSWSPDGKKIAFAGSSGPFPDIFVFNLESRKIVNVTHDIFTDKQPSWGADSQTIYFASDRGNKVELNKYGVNYDELMNPDLYNMDIYSVKVGSNRAVRLTKTPGWDETQPIMTRNGHLVYTSDKNGIPNAYEMNITTRTSKPLTNLISGILQMSVSADGSKMAISAYNGGYVDIYLINSPLTKQVKAPLKPNYWAKRRANEPRDVRVPALRYAREMYGANGTQYALEEKANGMQVADTTQPKLAQVDNEALKGLGTKTTNDTTKVDSTKKDTTNNGYIDYHNYVFGKSFEEEAKKKSELDVFKPSDNVTKDDKFRPHKYRLSFSPDFTYYSGNLSTYYGTYGLVQMRFSDVLGNQDITIASNLVSDLRNSDYIISYGNYEHRTNYIVNYFHSAQQYQTFYGQLVRYRTYGGGVNFQYPIDRYTRIDYGASVLAISRDFSDVYFNDRSSQTSAFVYPEITFTKDKSKAGYVHPVGGFRYALSLTASPPVTQKTVQFVSLIGDFRKYVGLGAGYSFAFRYSGGASFGRDAQSFFVGGMAGWINYRWSNNQIPLDNLSDIFLTMPAIPMRGYEYNSIFGDRFSLINAEFRFPIFAAILPGPIPILPLYNLTGVLFTDVGTAWGLDDLTTPNINEAKLNFHIAKPVSETVQQNGQTFTRTSLKGDILIGSGFGLRTILLGLPLRWDIGWPYDGKHFGHPINYISIGLDF
jgi:Tol biopolymer transport system component